MMYVKSHRCEVRIATNSYVQSQGYLGGVCSSVRIQASLLFVVPVGLQVRNPGYSNRADKLANVVKALTASRSPCPKPALPYA